MRRLPAAETLLSRLVVSPRPSDRAAAAPMARTLTAIRRLPETKIDTRWEPRP